MIIDTSAEAQPASKKTNSSDVSGYKFAPKYYTFGDDQLETIFHLLNKAGKLKLP